jgi:hypothetical protein
MKDTSKEDRLLLSKMIKANGRQMADIIRQYGHERLNRILKER